MPGNSVKEYSINLEQHLYTATDPEFETIAKSGGITDDMQHELEKHSLYFLPSEYLYEEGEGLETPVKYIFYPLGENHFAFGRGVYIGKDAIGRPGNYIFHTLVATADDMAAIQYQFLPVLLSIIQANLFSAEKATTLPVTRVHFKATDPVFDQQLLSLKNLPLVIAGLLENKNLLCRSGSEQVLKLAGQLAQCLPLTARRQFHFDSYCYGTGSYSGLNGLPEGEFFIDNQARDLLLQADQFSVNFQPGESSLAYGQRLTRILGEQSLSFCQKLISLQHTFSKDQAEFLKLIRPEQATVKKAYYSLFTEELVTSIHSGNLDLFEYFFDQVAEKDEFYGNWVLMNQALKEKRETILLPLANWQAQQIIKNQGEQLITQPKLWKHLLDRLEKGDIDINIPVTSLVIRLLVQMKDNEIIDDEEQVYRILFSQEPAPVLDEPSGEKIYSIVKKFNDSENEQLMLLREFFYCIRKDKISGDLLEADILQLPPVFSAVITRFILNHLAGLRLKKVEKWVKKLREEKQADFIRTLLDQANGLDIGGIETVKEQLQLVLEAGEA